ncbi:MAG: hypothetical protein AAGC88_05140 [Bacteroidota bacterium]
MNEAKGKYILVASILCTMYFSGLLTINHYHIEAVIIGVVVELVTIPILLSLVGLILVSGYLLIKERFVLNSIYLYSLIINLFTASILIVAT